MGYPWPRTRALLELVVVGSWNSNVAVIWDRRLFVDGITDDFTLADRPDEAHNDVAWYLSQRVSERSMPQISIMV